MFEYYSGNNLLVNRNPPYWLAMAESQAPEAGPSGLLTGLSAAQHRVSNLQGAVTEGLLFLSGSHRQGAFGLVD
jgi:hypothetical protein